MLPILSAHPLISAVLLLVIDLLVWQLVDERHKPWKIAARLGIFLLYSLLIFEAGLSPLQAAPWAGDVPLHLLAIVLEIVWWLFCARTLTVVIGPLLMPRGGHTGRLVQDVLGAIIFLVAIVAAAAYVMELPVRGLLATSGAVAIIVGLALQSTLGDVFSGIVLNTTKPYQLDDWISIDGIEGKVVEIDWRSTHLLTAQGSMAVVPNSVAAKAKILNLSRPRDVHGVSIRLELPRLVRPRKALDALERALQGCSELLSTPRPSVGIKSSGIDSVEYELTGFVDAMAKKAAVRNQLYDLAYRHLEASAVLREDAPVQAPREISRARALLDEVKIFRTLSEPQKDELSGHLMRRDHAAGEEVIALGALTEDLLIIGSGVIGVSVSDGATLIEAGRMGPGEIMGEESLISGQPSQALRRADRLRALPDRQGAHPDLHGGRGRGRRGDDAAAPFPPAGQPVAAATEAGGGAQGRFPQLVAQALRRAASSSSTSTRISSAAGSARASGAPWPAHCAAKSWLPRALAAACSALAAS